ncbi:MAG: pyridoxamine 5'-phosphate oxidase family protein [Candidatus Abyssubacteria bacterium]|nr:pyridoxamine 5'-phosphate oxidase family protein [Candidatus Abyssubacteria bacterium]
MARMPQVVMEKFADMEAAKFMATVDKDGNPNVAPILSIMPFGEEKLVFVDIMMNKTRKNLLSNGKVAASVLTKDGISYQVKGTFEGFQTSGPVFEMFASHPMLKYNSYSGPRAVGLIQVDSLYTGCPPLPGKEICKD